MSRQDTGPRPAARKVDAVLVDTGLLVALFNRLDPHHAAAARWMALNTATLLTVEAVLAEAAFFLPTRLRAALAGLAARGVLQVYMPNAAGHARMAELFDKYADQDPDWADLALVWLAESQGLRRIATLDVADFSVYRINGRQRFELAMLS
jgi:predicted nucleic acid-binding protein